MKRDHLLLFFAAFFVVLLYIPTFLWMKTRFLAEDSYYSHGFLVPFVSAFFVWRKSDVLRQAPKRPALWGMSLIAAGLLVHFLATWFKVHFVSGFSLIFVITGIILFLWGGAVLRLLWFPIAFLVFMVPLPSVFLIFASFKLKMLAASLAGMLARHIGIAVHQAGSTIYLPASTLVVDDTCSGLRSLISLLALGSVFAQLEPARTIPRRAAILAATVPIALTTNLIRIEMLILLSYVYGIQVAMGAYHTLSGFLVFGLATVMLMGIGKVFK